MFNCKVIETQNTFFQRNYFVNNCWILKASKSQINIQHTLLRKVVPSVHLECYYCQDSSRGKIRNRLFWQIGGFEYIRKEHIMKSGDNLRI